MDTLLQDLRYAIRTLVRSPGFTAAAVVALALGVGGSSAIFSVLQGVVLQPLPAPQSEQLVRLYEVVPGITPWHDRNPYSTLDYLDLVKESGAFESIAGVQNTRLSMTVGSGPEQLVAAKVTASFFGTLKVHPALGRGFASDTDYKGAAHEVVLTDRLWRREFSADPRILGQTTTMDGRTYTIVGVLPANFRFPLLRNAEALIPFEWDEKDLQNRGLHFFTAFARLKPGTSIRAAQADLAVVGPRIASRTAEHTGWSQRAVPLLDDLVGPIKPVLHTVVMSNAVHAYVSQSDKGDLVIGAGIDAYTGYGQRGSFHTIEHAVEAIVEMFPGFSRVRMNRQWGGIVDVCPDACPIIGTTAVQGLYLNCGWGTGGFKATPGSGWVFAYTIAQDRPHELNAPFSLERFATGHLIDEHGAAAVAH